MKNKEIMFRASRSYLGEEDFPSDCGCTCHTYYSTYVDDKYGYGTTILNMMTQIFEDYSEGVEIECIFKVKTKHQSQSLLGR